MDYDMMMDDGEALGPVVKISQVKLPVHRDGRGLLHISLLALFPRSRLVLRACARSIDTRGEVSS